MPGPFDFIPGAQPTTGRVALVTGGTCRLGTAVVSALAARGYSVAIHANNSLREARDSAAALESAGVPALAVAANLRDEGPVRALVHRVADHFGRIDAVVTCARIWRPVPFEEATADDLVAHFAVNVVGSFLVAQEAGAVMARQDDGGGIVTIGDGAADRPSRDTAAAAPSAGAIPALTKSLAVELAARNPRIRVNCVLPGPVMPTSAGGPDGRMDPVGGTPGGRAVTAGHVAHAVLFLLENDCVTGACLPVDAGRTIAP